MTISWLRENRFVSFMLLLLRIYLGWTWLKAGWEKVSAGGFNASGYLQGAVGKSTGEHPAVESWWAEFLTGVALPNVALFNVLVPWGELLVGIGLLTGTLTSPAVLMGMVMNFSYMFSGSAGTNPQMLLIGMILLTAGVNAGRIGADRWIAPWLERRFRNSGSLSKSAVREI
ncbi:DoxX family protein [Paenibacillus gansuensis]|uniref:DoxX family protein n=1 Tax=Paenibacillus gansuensis TaxID=306542 RepID=A0ABW5PHZ7_9BACL